MLSDIIQHPLVTKRDVDTERDVILRESQEIDNMMDEVRPTIIQVKPCVGQIQLQYTCNVVGLRSAQSLLCSFALTVAVSAWVSIHVGQCAWLKSGFIVLLCLQGQ